MGEVYAVPCGTAVGNAEAAIEHAARCIRCHDAMRFSDATSVGPRRGSTEARRRLAGHAGERARTYAGHVAAGPNPQQLERLAQSMAALEAAMALETSGMYGNEHASSVHVLARLKN